MEQEYDALTDAERLIIDRAVAYYFTDEHILCRDAVLNLIGLLMADMKQSNWYIAIIDALTQ